MSIVITLILLIVFIWLIGLWLGRGEDLARFDQPVDPAAFERFGQDSGPSAEHCEAENGIRAMGGQVRAMSRKEMLQFTRDFMEEMPAGRELTANFARSMPAEFLLNGCWRPGQTRRDACFTSTAAHSSQAARKATGPSPAAIQRKPARLFWPSIIG